MVEEGHRAKRLDNDFDAGDNASVTPKFFEKGLEPLVPKFLGKSRLTV